MAMAMDYIAERSSQKEKRRAIGELVQKLGMRRKQIKEDAVHTTETYTAADRGFQGPQTCFSVEVFARRRPRFRTKGSLTSRADMKATAGR